MRAGDDPPGRSHLSGAGGRFAVRRRLWRWAFRTATERRERPVALCVRGGPSLQSRWHEIAGRRLHARFGGTSTGLPVVLVHGVVVSGRYLEPLAVELAHDHPVLVPDLPGFGLSDGPPSRSIAVELLADALIDVVVDAGHQRAALVGNSFGAQIVVAAAARHPTLVDRVVLLGPTVDSAARTLPRQAVRWLRNAPDEHPASYPLMARDVLDLGAVRAIHALRTMRDDRIEDRLPAVRCPALVVRGDRDRVAPAAWVEQIARLLPDGCVATLAGYAHMPHFAGPLALAALLRPFLAFRPER
jgi:2-hydroxy-6-oxonona-2,4-dienedioate hydrolase